MNIPVLLHPGYRSSNSAPLAAADSYSVAYETETFFEVLDNDSDPEGDDLTIIITEEPSNGTAVVVENHGGLGEPEVIGYTPDNSYVGADSLKYRLYDGTSYSNEVTVSITVNAPVFAFGNGLDFDGIDDYVSFGGNVGNSQTKLTFSFWAKFGATPDFYIGSFITSNNAILITYDDANTRFNVSFRNGSTNYVRFPANSPYTSNHYQIVYNGDEPIAIDRVKFYINGVEISSIGSAFTNPVSLSSSIGNSFEIGGVSSLGLFGEAIINELAIWEGVAGTLSDAVALYNAGSGQFADSVIAVPSRYYRCNGEGGGSTLTDEGTDEVDGTINGAIFNTY